MKQTFFINVHSFSDVITNSSTDIFACKTKKSLGAINEVLTKLCGVVGIQDILTIREGTLGEFCEETDDYTSFDHVSKYLNLKSKKDKILIICGTDSNSIPYWLQNFIEDELNGYRVHLG